MSALAEAVDVAAAAGMALVRAHPRPDRLHLDLRGPDGGRVIGQWLPDRELAAEVAEGTEAVVPGATELHAGRLLVQRRGADRRLRALPGLAARGELVVHRPERRAVVRTRPGGGTGGGGLADDSSASPPPPEVAYTKVVRPRRTADLVRRMRVAEEVPGLRVPRVTDVDEDRGTVGLSTLPGRTLHDLLAEAGGPTAGTGEAVGLSLWVLHGGVRSVGESVPAHDVAAEVRAAVGIIDLARAHAVLPPRRLAELERAVGRAAGVVATAGPPARALLHRDLHDKQLLVDEDGGVGVLDVDGLALGDPALDLGNLLAHLDLRVSQGWTSRAVADALEGEVLAGYRPDARTRAAAAGYRALTAARLAALYAFRPGDLPG